MDSAQQSVAELRAALSQAKAEGTSAAGLLAEAESELRHRDADEAQRLHDLKCALPWLSRMFGVQRFYLCLYAGIPCEWADIDNSELSAENEGFTMSVPCS